MKKMKKTRNKPMKMWAVLEPKGRILLRSIAKTRRESIEAICTHSTGWEALKDWGFTVKRVTISVDKP